MLSFTIVCKDLSFFDETEFVVELDILVLTEKSNLVAVLLECLSLEQLDDASTQSFAPYALAGNNVLDFAQQANHRTADN